MNIVVDNKENDKFVAILKNHCEFVVGVLDIGDIVFNYNDQPYLFIERKTLPDLAASISDGRYREQKARLKGHRVIYLIEGETLPRTFSEDQLNGVVINTMVRDQIPVYQTKSMEDSAKFIKIISVKIMKYIADVINPLANVNSTDVTYTNALKSKKRSNVNTAVAYIEQLAQIPGVSAKIGQCIANEYPNMAALIGQYNSKNSDDEKEKMLANVSLGTKKIGPIVSSRIYHFLFGLN